MTKQLDLLGTDRIIPTALHSEMQRSYLEYAMSVIVGRALPDVRDGLKPVHRRILYAMHELGLTPDRPFRKCARVVGDVLGKYHPHGDQSVYDALVRLVQEFSTRYPLLSGHGNFGSVDNDPPAAMRYTETRLSPISHEALLGEISTATVDFIGNFDNSQQEPTVLPAQLPMLLINGCGGIAVGMATNIPPHNVGEVIDGLIALIDKPDLTDRKLWDLIPGPDFPTGGEIIGTGGIEEAYRTGKGIIPLRGVAHVEAASTQAKPGKSRKRRDSLIITELPYQVNKAGWIEKVAELVNAGKIEGIADLRDESDRQGMRVVIEIKRDTEPDRVLEQLYRQTALQSNFGAIFLAIVDGQPRQLTLRELLAEFLQFRETTLTRQYGNELEQAQRRVHLVSGLLTALGNLDGIIDILRNAPDGSTAKVRFQTQFNLTEAQSDAILAMPMRRLTGLERQNLQTEFEELTVKIASLNTLLTDRHELLKSLKKDLRSLRRKYADNRRTKINNIELPPPEPKTNTIRTPKAKSDRVSDSGASQLSIVEPEPPQSVDIEITQRGYVRKLTKTGNKLTNGSDDFVIQTDRMDSDRELTVITSGGKAYPLKIRDIPPTIGNTPGTVMNSLIPALQGSEERILTTIILPDEINDNQQLLLLTTQGKIKRILLEEVTSLTARGTTLIKLREDDLLHSIASITDEKEIIIATSGGRLLRLALAGGQIPLMGRVSQGIQALKVGTRETIVGSLPVHGDTDLLLFSRLGYAKRLPVMSIRMVQVGNIGTHAMQFTNKNDSIIHLSIAKESETISIVTNTNRREELKVAKIGLYGKDGNGDRAIKLHQDEEVIDILAHSSSSKE
jgi:DNA gyrase subunit A